MHEEHETARVAKPFAQDFRQAFAGDDAEFRGLVLDKHAHAVGQYQHPHQQVAVARARRDVRRHVARIHVCDRRHERGAEDAGERVAVVVRPGGSVMLRSDRHILRIHIVLHIHATL